MKRDSDRQPRTWFALRPKKLYDFGTIKDVAAHELSGGWRSRRFQPGFHLIVADQSRLLRYRMTLAENNEVWNASHVESCRHFWIAFRINLHDHCSSGHICGRTLNFRRRHSAWSTPGSPEIHQHGDPGVLNNFVEYLRINL